MDSFGGRPRLIRRHFAEVRGFFSEGEVVELMAAIGLFTYIGRFNDLLHLDPTKPGSAEELAYVRALAVH